MIVTSKRLPARDKDGTPFCLSCRKRGVLMRMIEQRRSDHWECPECEAPTWTGKMPLTWEEFAAGEDCRGCGQPLRRASPAPSWYSRGTGPYSDEERAAADAEEAAFREQHPICKAIRWSIEGRMGVHCGRCCPPPPLSPRQLLELVRIFSSTKKSSDQPESAGPAAPPPNPSRTHRAGPASGTSRHDVAAVLDPRPRDAEDPPVGRRCERDGRSGPSDP